LSNTGIFLRFDPANLVGAKGRMRAYLKFVRQNPKSFAKAWLHPSQLLPALGLSVVFGLATGWKSVAAWLVWFMLLQAPGVADRLLRPTPNPAIEILQGRLRNLAEGEVEAVPLRTVLVRDLVATMDKAVERENGWPAGHLDELQAAIRSEGAIGMTSDEVGYGIRIRSGPGEPRLVGAVTLAAIDPELHSAEIGWHMAPDVRGQGIGKIGLRLAVAGFRAAGLETVIIGTAETNVAVHRAAEGLGATLLRSGAHTLPNGTVINSRWYVLNLVSPPVLS
jgi:RimJ/RimL family protein N-acetyltransferase